MKEKRNSTENPNGPSGSLISGRSVRVVHDRSQVAFDLVFGHERPVLRVEQRHVV